LLLAGQKDTSEGQRRLTVCAAERVQAKAMKDQHSGHEANIIVAGAKLQEHHHTDGKNYVVMPR
jgi:hypothetical protein